jgi:hypothetical protein
MNKKTETLGILVLLGVLIFSSASSMVLGSTHHVDGNNWGYNQAFALQEDPWYCECYHTTVPDNEYDAMIGIGLTANYNNNLPPPAFESAKWQWTSQTGNDPNYHWVMDWWSIELDAGVNGNHNWGSDSSAPTYDWGPFGSYKTHFRFLEMYAYLDSVSSVESTATQWFEFENLGFYEQLQAETQVPAGQSGNGWSYLTATY